MVRCLRVEITFQYPLLSAPGPVGPETIALNSYTTANLSYLCDQLHLLVASLRRNQVRVGSLQVSFNFSYINLEPLSAVLSMKLLIAIQILLNPFRRLSMIESARVCSLVVRESQDESVDILPDRMDPAVRSHYDELLQLWSQALSGPWPSSQHCRALESYWGLSNLVSNIEQHFCAGPRFGFAGLLAIAKTARDVGDLQNLQRIWGQVVNLWFKYTREQHALQSMVTQTILAPNPPWHSEWTDTGCMYKRN